VSGRLLAKSGQDDRTGQDDRSILRPGPNTPEKNSGEGSGTGRGLKGTIPKAALAGVPATVSWQTKKIEGLYQNDFMMTAKLDHDGG